MRSQKVPEIPQNRAQCVNYWRLRIVSSLPSKSKMSGTENEKKKFLRQLIHRCQFANHSSCSRTPHTVQTFTRRFLCFHRASEHAIFSWTISFHFNWFGFYFSPMWLLPLLSTQRYIPAKFMCFALTLQLAMYANER